MSASPERASNSSSVSSISAPSRPTSLLGAELEVFVRREDAERFIEEVRGDDPELASHLRIEERELEAGGLNRIQSAPAIERARVRGPFVCPESHETCGQAA
jgi:hypothetical protein